MKFGFLYVLGFVFVLLGLTGFGVVVLEFISNEPKNPILGPLVSGMLIATGILVFIAVKTEYRITLFVAISAILVFFGLVMAAVGLEGLIFGEFGELIICFVLAAISFIASVWLVRWSHQDHLKTMTAQV